MVDFNAGRVTSPDNSEVFRQRLYDYQLYATAGVGQMVFFQTPVGQGISSSIGSVVGSPKTFQDTNMTQAGMLPSGVQYLAETIEVAFWPGSVSTANTYTLQAISLFAAANAASVTASANDVNTFYQSGLLEFRVLQKLYLQESPLAAFPPKTFFEGSYALATTSATAGEVALVTSRAGGRAYALDNGVPGINLQPVVNFDVTLKWPAPVATPSGFNARVGVILDGIMNRASQ